MNSFFIKAAIWLTAAYGVGLVIAEGLKIAFYG